jgi:hypothetical protein
MEGLQDAADMLPAADEDHLGEALQFVGLSVFLWCRFSRFPWTPLHDAWVEQNRQLQLIFAG